MIAGEGAGDSARGAGGTIGQSDSTTRLIAT
jgi:hypothetical protein